MRPKRPWSKVLSVWLEEPQLERLDALARVTNRTRSDVVRVLIDAAQTTGQTDLTLGAEVREALAHEAVRDLHGTQD